MLRSVFRDLADASSCLISGRRSDHGAGSGGASWLTSSRGRRSRGLTCVVVVAESRPAAARLSAGSPAVAAAPGSAAPGLPPAPHGRRLQLLPLQQLCPVLQHHVAVPRPAADVKELREGTSCDAASDSSRCSQLASTASCQPSIVKAVALVYVRSAADPGSANAFMTHAGNVAGEVPTCNSNVFSLNDLCSLFVLQPQTEGFKFILKVRPKAETKRRLREEPNK